MPVIKVNFTEGNLWLVLHLFGFDDFGVVKKPKICQLEKKEK